MDRKESYKIEGMSCGGCSGAVQSALLQTDGVRDARVSHEKGIAEVTHSLSDDDIAKIVESTGYHFAGKSR